LQRHAELGLGQPSRGAKCAQTAQQHQVLALVYGLGGHDGDPLKTAMTLYLLFKYLKKGYSGLADNPVREIARGGMP
jgi:hypothetical protein